MNSSIFSSSGVGATKRFVSIGRLLCSGRVPLVVLAVFVGAELSLRLALFGAAAVLRPGEYSPRANTLTAMVEPLDDPVIRFKMRPDLSMRFKGRKFSSNSIGCRSPEFNLEKSPGITRVVVVGASITMGAGVADEAPYPRQMEKLLNKKALDSHVPGGLNHRHEVMNCAVGGYMSNQVAAYYEEYLASLAPDIIIMPIAYDGYWSLEQRVSPQYPSLQDRLPAWDYLRGYFIDSFLYTALRGWAHDWLKPRLSGDWHERGIEPYAAPGVETTAAVMSRFIAARHKEGIPVVLVALHRLQESTLIDRAILRRRLLDWVDANPGVYLIDTLEPLTGKVGLADRVFPGDNHPNERIHSLYAQVIVPRLLALESSWADMAGAFRVPQ